MPVVNCKHEDFDVYIGRAGHGRSGYFGNPVVIGEPCPECGKSHGRSGVIACYKRYLWRRVNADREFKQAVLSLKGKRLGCFCAPLACHGDVIEKYIAWVDAGEPLPGPHQCRVLICGGRDIRPNDEMLEWLDRAHARCRFTEVYSGMCRGGDMIGVSFAAKNGIPVRQFPALWEKHGRSAGFKRNLEMIQAQPDLVISLGGGKGTTHTVRLAQEARITVIDYPTKTWCGSSLPGQAVCVKRLDHPSLGLI